MKIIKLGTIATDSFTGLKGMVNHFQINHGGNTYYSFQPRGLNKETGQPLDPIWVNPKRVNKQPDTEVDLPIEILGTEVEDMASGFKGTATILVYYLSGCVHIDVQPSGTIPKSGAIIASMQFDIRRLKGKAIKPLTEEAIQLDKKERQSPGLEQVFRPTAGMRHDRVCVELHKLRLPH